MKIRHAIALTLIILSAAKTINAQSDIYGLKLYGFFQTSFYQQNFNMHQMSGSTETKNLNTFWQQQMNLFLAKDISSSFSTFINFELTNSFSTERNWGTFNLEEAWLRYSYSNLLNIRGGLFIPSFNNLNTIKNRSIILPYIFRPLVYETAMEQIMSAANFVPQRANIEVAGELPVSDLKLNYSLYAGNSEDSYITSDSSKGGTSGTDSTKFKLIGGRIGLEYSNLKLGFSSTFDKHNQKSLGLGNVSRVRLGLDLSYSLFGFTLESEYIRVLHNLTDDQKATLKGSSQPAGTGTNPTTTTDQSSTATPPAGGPMQTTDLDKKYFYSCLSYNFTDNLYVYGKYDYIKDDASLGGMAVNGYSFGGGFKPNDDILLKLQYQQMKSDAVNVKYYLIGASIFF
ncbi:MAG: hypothetical protein Q8933_05370 [Bacteroidota bacterium]|nr:hypothetical protein [Bacteroidota bacterium]MDP4190106.1 hypothetical protein [Bacteroidota bacterium]MDP4193721.1 hypothetical protein [Bacteroidota bacterium]